MDTEQQQRDRVRVGDVNRLTTHRAHVTSLTTHMEHGGVNRNTAFTHQRERTKIMKRKARNALPVSRSIRMEFEATGQA